MKNKLKEVRLAAGMTQEQLANAIGSSKQYISQLETGSRDINRIQVDTMQRICAALGCEASDLIVSATKFECNKNGFLIVDRLYFDPHTESRLIAKIGDDFFSYPTLSRFSEEKTYEEQVAPLPRRVDERYLEEVPSYWYVMARAVRREGYDIHIGRAITEEEFQSLLKKYNIDEDHISKKFTDQRGAFYGDEYAIYFEAVQIDISASNEENPINIEQELRDKGIEAGAINAYCINIRIK